MIPALPTAAGEMGHHGGLQTLAAVCGIVCIVVTRAAIARRSDGSQRPLQRAPRAQAASCRWLFQAGLETEVGERTHQMRSGRIAELSRTRRAPASPV
jgi:hypothetical protein